MRSRSSTGSWASNASPFVALALTLAAVAAPALAQAPGCRCLPADACWAAVPWAALNASVGGRLAARADPLSACAADANASAACADALAASDDEFALTAQADGYLHTGVFGRWNLSTSGFAYAVLAESEADVQAAVSFAAAHNLRLVVKSTGHDWMGRSTSAGALLVWTHLLSKIAFEPAWTGSCGASEPALAAVTVGAGVQFRELYQAAQQQGRLVIGGTCDSVSVGGCWLGGCYGTFSQLFGSGASNLLSARVVLANGSLVVADACTNADLFFSLRGGGAGLAGVVVEFTARSHRAPQHVMLGGGSFSARDDEGYVQLLEQMLLYSKRAQDPALGGVYGGGGISWGSSGPGAGGFVSMWPKGYEATEAQFDALFDPLRAFVANDTARFSGSASSSVWNASSWQPGASLPWIEVHPDREISTALVGSLSKYPSVRQLETPPGVAQVAQAMATLSRQLPDFVSAVSCNVDFEKGQSGASSFALELLAETSTNPVLQHSLGLLLLMYNVPSLPTLPPSSGLLKALWPRLQTYVIGKGDALVGVCTAGAAGNETAAAQCFAQWALRVPGYQAQLAEAKATLVAAFPNEDSDGVPLSGSYWNEPDFDDDEWQLSHWGRATYARLLDIKSKFDPDGLFVCHHCVGSERWDATGNCPAT